MLSFYNMLFLLIIKEMRRKRRYGVYTNKTLKKCPCCVYYCASCKGKCKFEVIGYENLDDASIDHRKVMKQKPLHKFGVGSLERGRSFVFKVHKRHRCSSFLREEKLTRAQVMKDFNKDIEDGLLMYMIDKLAS